jgi:hypothetical protein
MKTRSVRNYLVTASALAGVFSLTKSFAATDYITPSNLQGWTLNSFDDNGTIVNSGPFDGMAAIVTGADSPQGPLPVPPDSIGSVHLATPAPSAAPDPSSPGAGGAEAVATDNLDGTLVGTITSLNYWAYMTSNGPENNQQFPYLALSVNTGAVDLSGDLGATANQSDTLFFEPPYQTPGAGNASLPNQGATVLGQWQQWNALEGGWWDNDSLAGMVYGGGEGDVQSLQTYLSDYPDAFLTYGGYPGLGGIAMQVGFADSTSQFDGNVQDLTIGIGGVNTTYAFVPEPASFSLVGVGAALLMRRRRA